MNTCMTREKTYFHNCIGKIQNRVIIIEYNILRLQIISEKNEILFQWETTYSTGCLKLEFSTIRLITNIKL